MDSEKKKKNKPIIMYCFIKPLDCGFSLSEVKTESVIETEKVEEEQVSQVETAPAGPGAAGVKVSSLPLR